MASLTPQQIALLQSLASSGNYAGLFSTANKYGDLGALTTASGWNSLGLADPSSAAQFQNLYKAFNPYEKALTGTIATGATGYQGASAGADAVTWGNPSNWSSDALANYQAAQRAGSVANNQAMLAAANRQIAASPTLQAMFARQGYGGGPQGGGGGPGARALQNLQSDAPNLATFMGQDNTALAANRASNIGMGEVALLALGGFGGAALAGAGAGAEATGAAAGSGYYDTGGLLASNTAGGVTDTGATLAGSGSAGAGATGAGSAAAGAGGGATGLSSYLPSNLISSYLSGIGVPQTVAGAVGGAAQGALVGGTTSRLRGGSFGQGALIGGITGGIGGGVSAAGYGQYMPSNYVSNAVGGGLPGQVLGGVAQGALVGGAVSGLRGQGFGRGALTGAVAGGVGGAANYGLTQAGAPAFLASTGGQYAGSLASRTVAGAASSPSGPGGAPSYGGSNMPNMSAGQGTIDWPTLLGGGAGLYSSFLGGRGQNTLSNEAQNAYTTALSGANFRGSNLTGPGGMSANLTGVNLGAFNPAYGNFANLAGASSGMAGGFLTGGLPSNIAGAAGTYGNLFGGATGALGGLYNSAVPGLTNAGFGAMNNPLVGQSYGNAGRLLGNAQSDFAGAYNTDLSSLLGALALPQAQQTAKLQNQEFGMGILGSTAGALQTQAQATGFGQADLAAQNQAMNQALGTMGMDYQGAAASSNIGNSLLNTGGGLVNTGAGLGTNLQNAIFGMAGSNLNAQYNIAGMPAGLASQFLQPGLSATTGGVNLGNLGLGYYGANLNEASQAAAAQRGAGYTMGGIVNNPNNLGPGAGTVNGLNSLFSSIGGNNPNSPFANYLQSILGNGGNGGFGNGGFGTGGTGYVPGYGTVPGTTGQGPLMSLQNPDTSGGYDPFAGNGGG